MRSGKTASFNFLDNCRHDFGSLDVEKRFKNYSSSFRSDSGKDLNTWMAKQKQNLASRSGRIVTLQDVTLFRYPGRDGMILSTLPRTQYLAVQKFITKKPILGKEGNNWKIVYEGSI